MPFKANQDRRHHIPKQRHRVTNWPHTSTPPMHACAPAREAGSPNPWPVRKGLVGRCRVGHGALRDGRAKASLLPVAPVADPAPPFCSPLPASVRRVASRAGKARSGHRWSPASTRAEEPPRKGGPPQFLLCDKVRQLTEQPRRACGHRGHEDKRDKRHLCARQAGRGGGAVRFGATPARSRSGHDRQVRADTSRARLATLTVEY